MKIFVSIFSFCILLFGVILPANAEDLLQVFGQAFCADPNLQIINAQRLSIQQDVPINRAELLPELNAIGIYDRQSATAVPDVNTTTANIILNVSQPIFDVAKFLNYKAAKMTHLTQRALIVVIHRT